MLPPSEWMLNEWMLPASEWMLPAAAAANL